MAVLFNYYLMPFHLSVVAFDITQRGRNHWYVYWSSSKSITQKIAPVWLSNSPLNVKFSKALIFVFTYQF